MARRSTSAEPRPPRLDIDGILVVDKPVGPTSHDVVAIVRRLSGARRVGHGGTLDPFAAGVLPVFLGQGTRMVEYHLRDDKSYRAVMVFGARSTTDDIDGELAPTGAPAPTRAAVEEALGGFVGTIEQRPPDFSAVRIAGRHAYELARHGQAPEIKPRTVTFHEISVVEWDERDPDRPAATVDLRCTAGTYVRALARDAGERLGAGAYLGALVRTASGPFRRESARPLDRVREVLGAGRIAELLLPVDTGLDAWPQVHVDQADLASLVRGQVVRARGVSLPAPGPDGQVRVMAPDGRLAAMARVDGGRLHPEKVLVGPAVVAAGEEPDRVVRVIDDIDHLQPGLRFVATVGVFDGVHLGHVHVLERLRALADELRAAPVAITFDLHPQAVITGRAPDLLCDPQQKLTLMADAGAEVIVVQRFDEAFRSQTAEQFLERLARGRELVGLVMSHESALGRDRQGTVETVQRLAARDGWRLVEVDTLEVDGAPVSSSRIRSAVTSGDLGAAERMLGRRLGIAAEVGRSDGTGWRSFDVTGPFVLPPAGRYAMVVGSPSGDQGGTLDVGHDGQLRLALRDGDPGDTPVVASFVAIDHGD